MVSLCGWCASLSHRSSSFPVSSTFLYRLALALPFASFPLLPLFFSSPSLSLFPLSPSPPPSVRPRPLPTPSAPSLSLLPLSASVLCLFFGLFFSFPVLSPLTSVSLPLFFLLPPPPSLSAPLPSALPAARVRLIPGVYIHSIREIYREDRSSICRHASLTN